MNRASTSLSARPHTRAGVTLHRPFVGNESPVWLAEIGIMSVPLPRRAH